MKSRVTLFIVVVILATLVSACGTSTPSEPVIVATATADQSQAETAPIEKAVEPPAEVKPTSTPEPSATPEPTSTVKPTEIPEPTETPEPTKIPELGDVVKGAGYSLSAIAVEDPATIPGRFYEPKEGEKLVAVEFIVGNLSGETFGTNVLYATLIDAEGFAYGAEIGLLDIDRQMELLDINPGERVKGWAGFSIPEEAKPASLKYTIRGSSSNVLQVGLSASEVVQGKEPEPTNTPMPDLSRLGDVVENYGYTLSAVSIEDPAQNPGRFYEPKEGEKLVAVEFIIGNTSGETFSSNVLYAVLVDTQGFAYGADTGLLDFDKQMELLDVNQGEKIKGWAGFGVPEDSVPAYFKYAIQSSAEKTLIVGLLP